MARARDRSPSSDPTATKRPKTSHYPTPPTDVVTESLILSEDPTPHFSNNLFDHNNVARLNAGYLANTPFKYALVEKLFQDDLLKSVKDECMSQLSFTAKETDIYKVFPLPRLLIVLCNRLDLFFL